MVPWDEVLFPFIKPYLRFSRIRVGFYYDLGTREIFDQVFISREGLGQETMHVKVMSE